MRTIYLFALVGLFACSEQTVGGGGGTLPGPRYSGTLNISDTNAPSVSIASDLADQFFLVAINFGQADFGDGLVPAADPGTDASLVISKYTASGALRFASAITGTFTANHVVRAETTSDDQLVIAVSGMSGDIDFGGGNLATDAVVKLAGNNGTHLWSVSPPPPDTTDDRLINALDVADDDTIIVGGTLQTVRNMGGSPLATPGPLRGFVAGLSPTDGSISWEYEFVDASGSSSVTSVAAGASGAVYFSGEYAVAFPGPTPLAEVAGEINLYVAAMDAAGSITWSRGFVGHRAEELRLPLGYNGTELFVAGDAQEASEFTGTIPTASVLALYNLSGTDGLTNVSSVLGSAPSFVKVRSMAIDRGNAPVTTGIVRGQVDFGVRLLSPGDRDALYVAGHKTSTANPRWANATSGTSTVQGIEVRVTPAGFTYVVGTFVFEETGSPVRDEMFVIQFAPET